MWKRDVVVARQLRALCLTSGLLAISIPVIGAPTGVRACFDEKDDLARTLELGNELFDGVRSLHSRA